MLIIHDHQLGFSINVDLQRVSNDHFGNEFGYLLGRHFEHLGQGVDAERLVLTRSSEEEGLESRFFEVNS